MTGLDSATRELSKAILWAANVIIAGAAEADRQRLAGSVFAWSARSHLPFILFPLPRAAQRQDRVRARCAAQQASGKRPE